MQPPSPVAHFDRTVASYMTTELDAAGVDASLDEIALLLERRKISAVPLLAADGTIAGVLSRSDLLRVGRLHAGRHTGAHVVALPDGKAGSLVSRAPLVCSPQTTLRDAASVMIEHGVHRLFVVRERRPVGVISTLDLTAAVRDARVAVPLAEVMSSPVVTVAIEAAVGEAAELLARTRVSSLIVVDDRWPLGVLSQADVLAASALPATTRVDDVMDPAVICMPARTCVHHAAAVASNLGVRRVAVSAEREMVGIVGGLDFARVAARRP